MPRFALALGLLASLAATTTLADGLADMSDAERAAFREEVRAYLLENPEVLVEAMAILQTREDNAAVERDAQMILAQSDAIFASPHDWVGGNPEGDLTLVEFMDYRCGYCRKAHDEVKALVETDGNIRYVVKEFPILGEASLLSSQFAISVRLLHGDDLYKTTHDALIALRGDPTPETLSRLATDLGLDPAPVLAKMGSDEVMEVIKANHGLADQMQISGTPTFVMKDMMLRGYVPLEGMREIVADLRADG
jgi:protein-disulfide isomerase